MTPPAQKPVCPTCGSDDPAKCHGEGDPHPWTPLSEGMPCCFNLFHSPAPAGRVDTSVGSSDRSSNVQHPEAEGEPERFTIYICKECGGVGWAFGQKAECCPPEHRHHGSHSGPVEVVEAASYDALSEKYFAEKQRRKDYANDAEALSERLARAERLASSSFGKAEQYVEAHKLSEQLRKADQQALAEAKAELERVKAEGTPGVLHAVDQAFYDLTVRERNAAWREIEALRAAADRAEEK